MVETAITHREFAEWIDYEGGYTGLLEHGLDVEEDVPEDVRELWTQLEGAYVVFRGIADQISEIIDF